MQKKKNQRAYGFAGKKLQGGCLAGGSGTELNMFFQSRHLVFKVKML